MKPGKLDQRIQLQSKARVSDGMGGNAESWVDVTTIWAMVRPLRANEIVSGERVEAKGLYRFVIRNRDVDETQRIVWRGVAYNIRAVRREGARTMYLGLDAERGVGV